MILTQLDGPLMSNFANDLVEIFACVKNSTESDSIESDSTESDSVESELCCYHYTSGSFKGIIR